MAIVIETLIAEDLDLGISDASKTHAGGGTLTGHQISISTLSTVGAAGAADTATWDPASVSNGASVSTTVAVAGAALGDFAIASFSLDISGLMIGAYVSSANVVTVTLYNLSGGVVNLSSGTVKVLVFKSR